MEDVGTLEFYPSSQISEAKIALTQHPQMLQELNEWEERQRIRELLTSGGYPLSGHRVSVCNVLQSQNWITGVATAHNTQTRVSYMFSKSSVISRNI